ncbi:retrovirus-related pol polyprotein from transposon TNT 1-94, partial [Tanacetum coccineum]
DCPDCEELSCLYLYQEFVERQLNAFQSERQNFSKPRVPQKVYETNDFSNLVTSNSVPTPQESKVMKNDNMIALGIFRINPSKTSREDKFVHINKVRASIRTNPITVSQPHVITKNHVNSDSHGLSSTGVDNIAKTRRPQPRSNKKNDVPSASKSSCIKNKEVEVEEHHRNLLLYKNKKPMSSECNNVKLAIRNDKSEVVCAMCKQCLITANHDVCVLNYVNGMNSRGKKQKANASNVANQKKHKPKIRKPNKVIQICLWCVNSGCSKHMTGNLKLLINFVWKFLGTVRFRNDHVAAILGYGDFQWGNILITRVYFVEGLGHNLFSVGQFCDSDLEVFQNSKYQKEYLCPSCEQGKSKKVSHPPKPGPNSKKRLHLLHMDLYGPMRVESINGKRKLDNGTEFKNQVLKEYFDCVGISHQSSSVRTPQQNRVVERRNQTLVEAARTMTLGSLVQKGDIGFFIGYSPTFCAYRVYNQRKKKIMETMNVTFDELSTMAFEQRSSKPGLQGMTSEKISSGLNLTYAPSTITTQQPTERKLDLLFEAMYDDYIGGQSSAATRTAPDA